MRRQALPWRARRRCDGGQVQPGPIPEIRSRFYKPETGHSLVTAPTNGQLAERSKFEIVAAITRSHSSCRRQSLGV
jgi:hypothetical protein